MNPFVEDTATGVMVAFQCFVNGFSVIRWILFSSFWLLMLLPLAGYAQSPHEAERTADIDAPVQPCSRIVDIEFDGLKRTKESYIRSEMSQFLGQCAETLDLGEVETELQLLNLFDEIHVETRKTGLKTAVLDIAFKEKWYFIPIPMISYIDEWMGGLFFMDMNAFGENNKFVIGGLGSQSKARGMAAFSTPSLVGRPGLSFFGSGAYDNVIVYDIDKHLALKYRSINYNIGVKLNYKFTSHTSAGIGASYLYGNNRPKDEYRDAVETMRDLSVSALALTGNAKYESSDWNGWFMSGMRAGFDVELALIDGDTVSPAVTVDLGYQRPVIWERLRIMAHAAGYYSYHARIPMYKKARVVGADILPTRVISPILIASGAGFEVGIYRFKWASFSIGAQYQIAYARDWDKSMAFHHGWSSGVSVNLSKIAFPAFSLGVAQDVTNGQVKFALGMGMSM